MSPHLSWKHARDYWHILGCINRLLAPLRSLHPLGLGAGFRYGVAGLALPDAVAPTGALVSSAGPSAAKTEVTASRGTTMTGHQKGNPRQPFSSDPFWRSSMRTGIFFAFS